MSDTLQSRPYRPDPEKACEKCCFNRGEHSPWCPWRQTIRRWLKDTGETERKPDAV